jgi:glycosyltransferase involved in cell wall biosynthesis
VTTPRVSVVVPFLNETDFLAEAIESVRAQTFREWELVLVDDGAPDGSRAVADRFAAAEPDRIRVLAPDPATTGAAAARNRGVRAARGALVAFLDADDVFLPAKLADGVAALDAHPEAGMLYAPTRWWHASRWRDWTERLGVEAERVHAPPTLLVRVLLRQYGDIPCTCGVLIRRTAIEDVGGFEERFALYEDQTLWAKLFLATRVYVARACHARYRLHAGSTSARAEDRGEYRPRHAHPAEEVFFDWLEDYVGRHGGDPAVLRALAEARAERRLSALARLPVWVGRALRRRFNW